MAGIMTKLQEQFQNKTQSNPNIFINLASPSVPWFYFILFSCSFVVVFSFMSMSMIFLWTTFSTAAFLDRTDDVVDWFHCSQLCSLYQLSHAAVQYFPRFQSSCCLTVSSLPSVLLFPSLLSSLFFF